MQYIVDTLDGKIDSYKIDTLTLCLLVECAHDIVQRRRRSVTKLVAAVG